MCVCLTSHLPSCTGFYRVSFFLFFFWWRGRRYQRPWHFGVAKSGSALGRRRRRRGARPVRHSFFTRGVAIPRAGSRVFVGVFIYSFIFCLFILFGLYCYSFVLYDIVFVYLILFDFFSPFLF